MKQKRNAFRVPNELITDRSLPCSARRLGAVFYAYHNPLGRCRKSLEELAKLSGLSIPTVRSGLDALVDAGYITRTRRYRHDENRRPVFAKSEYHCDLSRVKSGYTSIDRSIFQCELTSSAFVVALYLYQQMGGGERSWPSLNQMSKALAISHSTVAVCVSVLRKGSLFLIQLCRKVNRAFSNNSYWRLHSRGGSKEAAPAVTPAEAAVCPNQHPLRRWLEAGSRLLHTYCTRWKSAVSTVFRQGGSPVFCRHS